MPRPQMIVIPKMKNETIQEAISAVRLHSAEKHFVKKSLCDMDYTSAFGGVY